MRPIRTRSGRTKRGERKSDPKRQLGARKSMEGTYQEKKTFGALRDEELLISLTKSIGGQITKKNGRGVIFFQRGGGKRQTL